MYYPLPETNIFAPENPWLEDEFPFGARPLFRGENVSFRGCSVRMFDVAYIFSAVSSHIRCIFDFQGYVLLQVQRNHWNFEPQDAAGDAQDETQEMIQEDILKRSASKTAQTIWAMKKRAPGCLLYKGDEILPRFIGIIMNHEIWIPMNQPVFKGK